MDLFEHYGLGKLTAFQSVALWAGLTALCAIFSLKVLRLRGSMGLAASGSILSLGAYIAGMAYPGFVDYAKALWLSLNFSNTVSHGVLGILLFAGAMRFDIGTLKGRGFRVLALSTLGVAVSAGVFAGIMWCLSRAVGVEVPWAWLFVFGALISPTDPAAVISSLHSAKAPKALEIDIGAESLFNDGMAIALFTIFLAWAVGGGAPDVDSLGSSFMRQAGGGLAFGLCAGGVIYFVLKSIDDASIETAITIALALCVYSVAESLKVSAPLATVVCGLLVGRRKSGPSSEKTSAILFPFWEVLEEVLTLSLFAMAGLSAMGARLDGLGLAMGGGAILAAMCARLASVSLSTGFIPSGRMNGAVAVMTWGGVRGVVSIAMAMALPASPWRDLIVSCSWFVVMFGLLVQAPSLPALLKLRGMVGIERFRRSDNKRRGGYSRRGSDGERRADPREGEYPAPLAALLRDK